MKPVANKLSIIYLQRQMNTKCELVLNDWVNQATLTISPLIFLIYYNTSSYTLQIKQNIIIGTNIKKQFYGYFFNVAT